MVRRYLYSTSNARPHPIFAVRIAVYASYAWLSGVHISSTDRCCVIAMPLLCVWCKPTSTMSNNLVRIMITTWIMSPPPMIFRTRLLHMDVGPPARRIFFIADICSCTKSLQRRRKAKARDTFCFPCLLTISLPHDHLNLLCGFMTLLRGLSHPQHASRRRRHHTSDRHHYSLQPSRHARAL